MLRNILVITAAIIGLSSCSSFRGLNNGGEPPTLSSEEMQKQLTNSDYMHRDRPYQLAPIYTKEFSEESPGPETERP